MSSASSTPSHYSTGENKNFTAGEKQSQFTEEKHRLPQSLLAAAPNKFGKFSTLRAFIRTLENPNLDHKLANLSVTHCSQRRRESTGGEEAPIVE